MRIYSQPSNYETQGNHPAGKSKPNLSTCVIRLPKPLATTTYVSHPTTCYVSRPHGETDSPEQRLPNLLHVLVPNLGEIHPGMWGGGGGERPQKYNLNKSMIS